MLEALSDLPGWLSPFKPVVRWVVTAMRPQVIFGCPRHPLHTENDPHGSWWHVPIFLRTAKISRRKLIERATVRFVLQTGGGGGISLRWYSRDHAQGISTETLEVGRIYLVPVVWRDENGDGRAFITNEDWMLKQPNKEKWPLPPGRHHFWMEVHAGETMWRSPYVYRVNVPNSGVSNGRFTLEVYYGGVY